MTEPSLPKKSLGLPTKGLGLPTSTPAPTPEVAAEETAKPKKSLGSLGSLKIGKDKALSPSKAAKKAKAPKPTKEEAAALAAESGVEKKSLLKMSPEEIKDYFKQKRNGPPEPVVAIEDMVFIPKKPEVNLLPPEILEGYEASALKVKLFKIGGAVAFIFLVMFGLSMISQTLSQGEMKDLEGKSQALNLEIRQLQPYELYKATIDGKREALYNQIQKNLDVGKLLDSVNTVGNNSDIKFTTVSLDSSGGQCTSTDPFATASPTIGCLSFTAEGNGADSVNKFYSETGKIAGFVNPYVPGSAAISKDGKSTLTGTIGITEEFYSKNNNDLSIPLDTTLADQANKAATTPEGNK